MVELSLPDFLKKYSNVNNTFIDDFFGMYDIKDKNNFSINVEKIAKWLKMKKGNVKKTLKASYIKNIDYTVTKENKNVQYGTSKKETILVTPVCFKLLCMQSKSLKSAEVRLYYIELEELIDKYKIYIIDGLNNKVDRLENNQKPKIYPKKGVIYILHTADDISLYKIGKTEKLKNRLKGYNSDKSNDIIPIYIYESDNINEVEQCVKMLAKEYQYRKYKEVYKTDINMLKDLIRKCDVFINNVKLKMKNKPVKTQSGGNYYIAIYK